MSNRTEWAELMTTVRDSGWATRKCRHGVFVYPPSRSVRPITIPGTPGEYRSFRNCRAELRRAGLNV
jgi:hypothetical protein